MNLRANLDRYCGNRAMNTDRPVRRRSRSPPPVALGFRLKTRMATPATTSGSCRHPPDRHEPYETPAGQLL